MCLLWFANILRSGKPVLIFGLVEERVELAAEAVGKKCLERSGKEEDK